MFFAPYGVSENGTYSEWIAVWFPRASTMQPPAVSRCLSHGTDLDPRLASGPLRPFSLWKRRQRPCAI